MTTGASGRARVIAVECGRLRIATLGPDPVRYSLSVIACALLIASPATACAQAGSRPEHVDVLIHDAMVYDGTGGVGHVTVIGLRGDRAADVRCTVVASGSDPRTAHVRPLPR